MQAPQVGHGIICLAQQSYNLLFSQTYSLGLFALVCWMGTTTPCASTLWAGVVGSNMSKPPTHPTTPSTLPCNLHCGRGLLWHTKEFHVGSFGTQELKALCIWVGFLEEVFNQFGIEWQVVCGHNVPDKTSAMEHIDALFLILEPGKHPQHNLAEPNCTLAEQVDHLLTHPLLELHKEEMVTQTELLDL